MKLSTLAAVLSLALVTAAAAQVVQGTPGNDTLTGTEAADLMFGRGGDDAISGLGGGDILLAGKGNDTVDGGDGVDVIWGGAGDDTLRGGNGLDVIRGRSGNDTVDGGEGNDRLFGGHGADTLYGGFGDDRLHALAKDGQPDTLDCGPGNDVAVVREGEVVTIVGCETVNTVPANARPSRDEARQEVAEARESVQEARKQLREALQELRQAKQKRSGNGVVCVRNTQLRAANEAPTASTSTAKGHAQIKVRRDGSIEYKIFVLNRDGETFEAGHIHEAPAGSAGPVVATLFTGQALNARQIRLSGTLTGMTQLASEICADPEDYYVNLHTATNSAGAIRGQLG